MIESTTAFTLAIITAGVTAACCPPLIAILKRHSRYDVACERSSHSVPTPRGGGIAVVAGAGAAVVFAAVSLDDFGDRRLWVVLVGAGLLAAVGFADDVRGFSPVLRLLAQIGVGLGCGAALGGLLGAIMGAVVVPAAVNMVNFMDGINGLAAGHAAVWGVGAMLAVGAGGGLILAVFGAISLGGGLGFLPWNAPRARLFLGDVGSYFFGALAGIGLLSLIASPDALGAGATTFGLVCAPYLLFALDTSTAIVRRLRAGEHIFLAHRTHVYQRLVNEGELPHWVVSAAMVITSLVVTLAVAWDLFVGAAFAFLACVSYLASPRLFTGAVTA